MPGARARASVANGGVISYIMRFLSLLLLLTLGGCSLDSGCSDRVLEIRADLEGPLVAWRYVRDCGATTDTSMNIAVGPREAGLAGATLVFMADSNLGAAEMDGLIDQGPNIWVEMTWTRAHNLSVAYARKARVFRSIPEAAGATIVYRGTTRNVMLPPPPPPS